MVMRLGSRMSGKIKTGLGICLSIGAFLFALLGLLALLSLSQFPYRLSQSQGISFRAIYFLTTAFFVGGLFSGVAGFCLAQTSKMNVESSGFMRGGIWAGISISFIGLAMLCFDIGNWGIHSTPSALNTCLNNLRKIDEAKEEWVLRSGATNGTEVSWENIERDFPKGFPVCPEGGKYNLARVGEPVTCSNPNHRIPSQ